MGSLVATSFIFSTSLFEFNSRFEEQFNICHEGVQPELLKQQFLEGLKVLM